MLITSFLLAFREIRRHVMRSVLTTLGIVIGVFSVVTMVTLGNGATASVKSQISSLGSNVLQVAPGQPNPGARNGTAPPFKLSDLEAIREQIGGVNAVAGQARSAGLVVHNAQNWSTSITGTTDDYFRAQSLELASGRLFTPAEEQAGAGVCIIGKTIVNNLIQQGEPVGQSIRVKDVACDVIGVLEARGQSGFSGDQDDVVIMPLKAVQRRLTGNQDVTGIIVGIDPAYDSDAIHDSLSLLLRERRSLGPADEDNFMILDARQLADTVAKSVGVLTGLIAAVAGVSLLVGGIGIMNIMLVSVTERTREIGIRLAIGALGGEVLMQFLVESVVLSCMGGIFGLLLAFLVTVLAAPAMGVPFLFNPGINLLGFGFSAFIGVAFGYFPARRAAGLNPIDALRYD